MVKYNSIKAKNERVTCERLFREGMPVTESSPSRRGRSSLRSCGLNPSRPRRVPPLHGEDIGSDRILYPARWGPVAQ